jgi:hypothetical protein
VFWKKGGDSETEGAPAGPEAAPGPIEIERDAPRPPTILKVAGELERRGNEILELFKEVSSPAGTVVLPIHLRQDGEEFFVEIATGPWNEAAVSGTLRTVSVLRDSEHAEAGLELLSAYPVPEEIHFLQSRSPAALFQLDLMRGDADGPEQLAESFRATAERHWGVELGYAPESLTLAEDLLLAALEDAAEDDPELPPVTEALVRSLGCYLGEVIRRNADESGYWRSEGSWGEGPVLEFGSLSADPLGKSRAFLSEGPEDSITFYAHFLLEEMESA